MSSLLRGFSSLLVAFAIVSATIGLLSAGRRATADVVPSAGSDCGTYDPETNKCSTRCPRGQSCANESGCPCNIIT